MSENFFVTTPRGLEELVFSELTNLGFKDIKQERGGVRFSGNVVDGYKACLWLRTASRVLRVLAEFHCSSPEELYAGVKSIKWPVYVTPDMTIAVDSTLRDSAMTHSGFVALKSKDAIVDSIRDKFGRRPSVDSKLPDLQINVHLVKNRCTVSLDMSGAPLDRRGYRLDRNKAPLRENLAAALVLWSGWKGEVPFYDPMCGSGTIAIEAALIAMNHAPGLLRERFGFQSWPGFEATAWRSLLNEAKGLRKSRLAVKIKGHDSSLRSIDISKQNAARAGVERAVAFTPADFSNFEPLSEPAMIIMNPPYGERIGEIENLISLYKQIGDTLKQRCTGATAYLLCANNELIKHIGLKASRKIPLWNGPLECRLLKFEMY
ncbi:MAG: THUMP domain-containing protein [Desulfuromonadales bacterium]|nr:THUMP domain-containing protein [Desulfuromonadales bacterium]